MSTIVIFDRKGRKHVEPACDSAREIGKLTPERKRMFLEAAKDLDERAPDTPATETDDDDCSACGWPADEHGARKN